MTDGEVFAGYGATLRRGELHGLKNDPLSQIAEDLLVVYSVLRLVGQEPVLVLVLNS
mgnify:CR=1